MKKKQQIRIYSAANMLARSVILLIKSIFLAIVSGFVIPNNASYSIFGDPLKKSSNIIYP